MATKYLDHTGLSYFWGKIKAYVHNVPSGGTSGQVLTKNSSTDYDVSWVTPSGGSGGAVIHTSTSDPTSSDGNDGEFWVVYEEPAAE